MLGYVIPVGTLDDWLNKADRLEEITERFKDNHPNATVVSEVHVGPEYNRIYLLVKIDEQRDTEEDEFGYWI